jgi:hypothetical protein
MEQTSKCWEAQADCFEERKIKFMAAVLYYASSPVRLLSHQSGEPCIYKLEKNWSIFVHVKERNSEHCG